VSCIPQLEGIDDPPLLSWEVDSWPNVQSFVTAFGGFKSSRVGLQEVV
jgi:hypothetical protein